MCSLAQQRPLSQSACASSTAEPGQARPGREANFSSVPTSVDERGHAQEAICQKQILMSTLYLLLEGWTGSLSCQGKDRGLWSRCRPQCPVVVQMRMTPKSHVSRGGASGFWDLSMGPDPHPRFAHQRVSAGFGLLAGGGALSEAALTRGTAGEAMLRSQLLASPSASWLPQWSSFALYLQLLLP